MIERLKNESGYSLVEVMVAIMILALAILPMVSMFDAGLRAAVLGSNYDKARAIAGGELERITALPYSDVRTQYPPPNSVTCASPAGFDCQVKTTYVLLKPSGIEEDSNASNMMSVEVTVTWDGGSKSYTTAGLVSRETW